MTPTTERNAMSRQIIIDALKRVCEQGTPSEALRAAELLLEMEQRDKAQPEKDTAAHGWRWVDPFPVMPRIPRPDERWVPRWNRLGPWFGIVPQVDEYVGNEFTISWGSQGDATHTRKLC